MDCTDGGHLTELATFATHSYPKLFFSDISWSPDGNFALVSGTDANNQQSLKLLSLTDGTVEPGAVHAGAGWGPAGHLLVYFDDGQTLSFVDAQTLSVLRKTDLPLSFQTLIWSPDQTHIALQAADNSLWQIDYPGLNNLEQLTRAMPGTIPGRPYQGSTPRVRNLAWSPDGTSLAFIGGMDIYIVDTTGNP
jgi:WD40 repeat protein